MFNISTNEIQAHIQIDPENVSCEKKKKERKRVRNIIYDFWESRGGKIPR